MITSDINEIEINNLMFERILKDDKHRYIYEMPRFKTWKVYDVSQDKKELGIIKLKNRGNINFKFVWRYSFYKRKDVIMKNQVDMENIKKIVTMIQKEYEEVKRQDEETKTKNIVQ